MSSRRNIELALLLLALIVSISAYLIVGLDETNRVPSGGFAYGGTLVAVFLAAHLVLRWRAPQADPLLLPCAALLNGLGLAMIRRLDYAAPVGVRAQAPLQAAWTIVGLGVFVATILFVRNHRLLARYRYTWLLIGLALLLSPLLPGIGRVINGGRLWIGFGPIQFQPSEGAKIALAIFFASYLTERKELLATATYRIGPFLVPEAKYFVPLIGAWVMSLAVFFFESDLGSSLLFFGLFVALLYVATGRASYVLASAGLFGIGAYLAYRLFPHVQVRIEIWLHLWRYYSTSGYQLAQGLFSLGTGGIFGQGWAEGRPSFIPFASTDFIFAAFGEELGLLGTTAILLTFLLLTFRGLRTALAARDDFGKLLATGLIVTLALQVFVIVGGVLRIIPLTGITLPFVSYGGSSLLANYVLIALLCRISDDAAPSPAAARAEGMPAPGEVTLIR